MGWGEVGDVFDEWVWRVCKYVIMHVKEWYF